MSKKELIDYDFKAINYTDFELTFKLKSDHKTFSYIFEKSKEKLRDKHSIHVAGNIDIIAKLDIPEKYYNLISTSLRSLLSTISKQVAEDGIKVIEWKLNKCFFERIEEIWEINFLIKGVYSQDE